MKFDLAETVLIAEPDPEILAPQVLDRVVPAQRERVPAMADLMEEDQAGVQLERDLERGVQVAARAEHVPVTVDQAMGDRVEQVQLKAVPVGAPGDLVPAMADQVVVQAAPDLEMGVQVAVPVEQDPVMVGQVEHVQVMAVPVTVAREMADPAMVGRVDHVQAMDVQVTVAREMADPAMVGPVEHAREMAVRVTVVPVMVVRETADPVMVGPVDHVQAMGVLVTGVLVTEDLVTEDLILGIDLGIAPASADAPVQVAQETDVPDPEGPAMDVLIMGARGLEHVRSLAAAREVDQGTGIDMTGTIITESPLVLHGIGITGIDRGTGVGEIQGTAGEGTGLAME